MFSRSFIRSPKETAQAITARANPTRESVRRSSACSGEHNYTYAHTGFRTFQDTHESSSNYTENLIKDYNQVYEEGKPTLPYHAALTALHHKTASTAVTRFLGQMKTTLQLVHMHDTSTSAPTPTTHDYARSQHLLSKMEFALPPYHPKRTVIVRGTGVGVMNFDPTQLPLEQRFIKSCCHQESSADTCCCHVGSSHESVQYVNYRGDLITVHYFPRKNEYFNTAFRMWGDNSDREKAVPHSPKSEVSDTEIFPCSFDNELEDEIQMATEAVEEGFTYVWKNKSYQRRHQRRQRRCQQLASGELPKYGLILVHVETKEIRSANPHPTMSTLVQSQKIHLLLPSPPLPKHTPPASTLRIFSHSKSTVSLPTMTTFIPSNTFSAPFPTHPSSSPTQHPGYKSPKSAPSKFTSAIASPPPHLSLHFLLSDLAQNVDIPPLSPPFFITA